MSTDIALLFARDPLEHSEQDIDKIIEHMRKMRVTFDAKPAESPLKRKKPTKAEQKTEGLDLGSLGLKL